MTHTMNPNTKAGNFLLRTPRAQYFANLLVVAIADSVTLLEMAKRDLAYLHTAGLVARHRTDGRNWSYAVTDHGRACLAEWQNRTYPAVADVIDEAYERHAELTTPAGQHIEDAIVEAGTEPATDRFQVVKCLIGTAYAVKDTETDRFVYRTADDGTNYRMSRQRAEAFAARLNSGSDTSAELPALRDAHGVVIGTGAGVRSAYGRTLGVRGTAHPLPDGQIEIRHADVSVSTRIDPMYVEVIHPGPSGDEMPDRCAESTPDDGRRVVVLTPLGVVDALISGGFTAQTSAHGEREVTAYSVRHLDGGTHCTYPASAVLLLGSDGSGPASGAQPTPAGPIDPAITPTELPDTAPALPATVPFASGVRAITRSTMVTLPTAIGALRFAVDDQGDGTVADPVRRSAVEIARAQFSPRADHPRPRPFGQPVEGHPFRVLGLCDHEMPAWEWGQGYRRCEPCGETRNGRIV